MAYPLKDSFRKNDPLRTIPAAFLTWIAHFFNTATWQGITLTPTSTGRDCTVRVNVDETTITLTGTPLALSVLTAAMAGDGLTEASGVFSVDVDGTSIEIAGGKVAIKTDGVDKTKLAADCAGAPISQGAGGDLTIAEGAITSTYTTGTTASQALGVPGTTLHFTNGLLTSIT